MYLYGFRLLPSPCEICQVNLYVKNQLHSCITLPDRNLVTRQVLSGIGCCLRTGYPITRRKTWAVHFECMADKSIIIAHF